MKRNELQLTNEPPTTEELQEALSAYRRVVGRWIVGVSSVAVALALAGATVYDPADPMTGFAIGFLTPPPVIFFSLAGAVIHRSTLIEPNDLEPLTIDRDATRLEELATTAAQYAVIRRYFQKVSAQGRMPVHAEYNAAKRWAADLPGDEACSRAPEKMQSVGL